jgi:hypothetical protein
MLHQVTKSVSPSDVWGFVTLALCVGLIFSLATNLNSHNEAGSSLVVSSTPTLTDRL